MKISMKNPAVRRSFERWCQGLGPEYSFKKSVIIRGIGIRVEQRKGDPIFGRFGGGWDFELGIQASDTTVMAHYGIGSIVVTNYRKLARKYPETYTHEGRKPREEKP